MKLVIDIPKSVYKACKEKMNSGKGGLWLEQVIANGTPHEERPKGKWNLFYECPKCGELRRSYSDQCPFCGADMR